MSNGLFSNEFFHFFFTVIVLSNGYGSNCPLTPSARISALNIVSDLLRKVGVSRRVCDSCPPQGSRTSSSFSCCLPAGSGIQARRLQELCQGPEGEEDICSRQQQRAQRKLFTGAPYFIFRQGVSEAETRLPSAICLTCQSAVRDN